MTGPFPDWIYRQSAVLPYRGCGAELEVLLITTRRSKRWTLPKGIVEPGMSPAASALKEAGEEAGVSGLVGRQSLGSYQREKWGGLCQVEVFPLAVTEVAADWPEAAFRKRVWLSPEEAAGRLRPEVLSRLVEALPEALAEVRPVSLNEPAPRIIILFRHAKSSWSDATLADHERPLAARGRRACEAMGRYLRLGDIHPQLVLCSTAARTCETLARLRLFLGEDVPVHYEHDIYLTEAPGHLALLRRQPAALGSVMVIGHNPGLEDLAQLLVGSGDAAARARMAAKFPTAALAILIYRGEGWAALGPGACELHSFVAPRDFG